MGKRSGRKYRKRIVNGRVAHLFQGGLRFVSTSDDLPKSQLTARFETPSSGVQASDLRSVMNNRLSFRNRENLGFLTAVLSEGKPRCLLEDGGQERELGKSENPDSVAGPTNRNQPAFQRVTGSGALKRQTPRADRPQYPIARHRTASVVQCFFVPRASSVFLWRSYRQNARQTLPVSRHTVVENAMVLRHT